VGWVWEGRKEGGMGKGKLEKSRRDDDVVFLLYSTFELMRAVGWMEAVYYSPRLTPHTVRNLP
jgi:hypothetical protein